MSSLFLRFFWVNFCRAFDSLAPAHSAFGLPVYVARRPPAPFCETPSEKDWRLIQRPYRLSSIYGPATASSGNVTVGVPSDLFSHRLRHSSSRRAGKRRRVARPMPNAKALG